MKVEPIPTQPNAYMVQSESNPEQFHLVDLEDQCSYYSCTCTDFITRRHPNMKKGSPPYSGRTLCKHVSAALLFQRMNIS